MPCELPFPLKLNIASVSLFLSLISLVSSLVLICKRKVISVIEFSEHQERLGRESHSAWHVRSLS